MRKYFIVAYVIIGLLVVLLIASNFNIKGIGGFNFLKRSLRKGNALELDGGTAWLNTDKPISIDSLKGKVVLLNFLTYSNINCIHTIDNIKKIEAKYLNNLVVIGVHSGKFTSESDTDNLRQAILRHRIKHPVVNDATFAIWHKYHVNMWPTIVLVDPKGFVMGYYKGEGDYKAIDNKIEETIADFKLKGLLDEKPISFVLEKSLALSTDFSFPGKVVADEETNRLFISDSNHNRIVITDLDGKLIDIAGSGSVGKSDGVFSKSSFNRPQGLAYSNNFLYVADTNNHLIRELDLNKKVVSTIAGTGMQAELMGSGGDASVTALNSPWDLIIIDDAIYITMAGSHQIWKMELSTNSIFPFAGNTHQARIDGPLLSSSLAQPSGITTDGTKLYIADSASSSIRSVDLNPEGGNVSSLVGLDLFLFGDKDGISSEIRLQYPLGVLYHNGSIYITDTYNHKIKVLNLGDISCKTISGTGKAGKEDGIKSQFYEPSGLTYMKDKLYIADTNNHVIRVANMNTGEVSTLKITGL